MTAHDENQGFEERAREIANRAVMAGVDFEKVARRRELGRRLGRAIIRLREVPQQQQTTNLSDSFFETTIKREPRPYGHVEKRGASPYETTRRLGSWDQG